MGNWIFCGDMFSIFRVGLESCEGLLVWEVRKGEGGELFYMSSLAWGGHD